MTVDQKAKNILLDKTCDTCTGYNCEKEGETCLEWKEFSDDNLRDEFNTSVENLKAFLKKWNKKHQ